MKNLRITNKAIMIVVLLLLLLLFSACANNDPPVNDTDDADIHWDFYNERAESFVTALSDGDFEAAAGMFDAVMKRALPVSALKNDVWGAITKQAGDFVAVHKIDNTVYDGYYICFVTSQHQDTGVTLRIVFSQNGLVSGLFIDGYPVLAGEITQRDGFTDFPVIIGEGTEFPLDGILSVPDNAAGKIPAVVIVHGSGPVDMDGTVLANKPYRDIAEYLALNGVAVVRYNKRTLTHGARVDGSWTVREETIYDAILATEMVKADPRIDENRVFIIGHSLGGMLAPRIHAEGGDFAGLILLAGSPRFIMDVSKDQNIALINETMEGKDREAALAQIEESWDAQIAELISLPDDAAMNTPVEGGVSAYYFKDLFNNPMSAYINEIAIPILVLQGSKDVQIPAGVDYVLFREMLAGRSNVDFVLYEGLNHLFMPSTIGTMAGLMDEYAIESRVDSRVSEDIVKWIQKH